MKKMLASRAGRFFLTFAFISGVLFVVPAASQTTDTDQQRGKAMQLIKDLKFTEALPLLESLAKSAPLDPEVRFFLGFALLGQAKNTPDPAAAKALRARARAAFVQAKELGADNPTVQGLIDGIPPDGGTEPGFTANAEANKLMEEGEKAFSSGKLDDALAFYQKALGVDPKLYHAALFSGDVYMQKGKFSDAETWYQKAIEIDPFVETAYRYSATPLMKQNKTDLARERYVEAFIVEPYNRLAIGGLVGWGDTTGTQLGHPNIDVPEINIGDDGKAKAVINVPSNAEDGSLAWASYITTRELWRKGKFVTTFPAEKSYRHSLKEEAEALRSVIMAAKAMKPKALNAQIQTLSRLDEDGVLEAYILMARPDNGIARDHHDYLKANREKLRLYVNKYVIRPK